MGTYWHWTVLSAETFVDRMEHVHIKSHPNHRITMRHPRGLMFEQLELRQILAGNSFEGEFPFLDTRSVASDYHVSNAIQPLRATSEGEAPVTIRRNPVNPYDVNHDGVVAPVDVLVVINAIRRFGTGSGPVDPHVTLTASVDVNDDQSISPIDALQVINFLSFAATFPAVAEVAPLTYAIGNSLTGDLVIGYFDRGFDKLTSSTPFPTTTIMHLNCSRSLTAIWENPEQTCSADDTFGKYREALQHPIDNLLLQPSSGSTLEQEIQSIKNLIDYAKKSPDNSDTRFFVYATWAGQLDLDNGKLFFNTWLEHEAKMDGTFVSSKSTYELMLRELRVSGYDVSLIPAGHIWASVIDLIQNGEIFELTARVEGVDQLSALTVDALWRDFIHASPMGKYVAGLTAYSAFTGREPKGLSPSTYVFDDATPSFTPDSARLIEQVAWNAYLYAVR